MIWRNRIMWALSAVSRPAAVQDETNRPCLPWACNSSRQRGPWSEIQRHMEWLTRTPRPLGCEGTREGNVVGDCVGISSSSKAGRIARTAGERLLYILEEELSGTSLIAG